jgi:hypothetical protein
MKCAISLLVSIVLLLAIAAATSSGQARGQSPDSVAGDWTLTTLSDSSGRDINFKIEKGRLEGTYVTSKKERKSIRNARFSRGYFYFEVPDLQLYFELRLVKDRYEGKMSAYSSSEKRVPEPVKMSRKG